MDTASPAPLPNEDRSPHVAQDVAPDVAPAGPPRRPPLPEQPRLPLTEGPGSNGAGRAGAGPDDAHDQPIGFALTARARRVVAPDSLPELTVVHAPQQTDEATEVPDDTRPARARALRRAGVPVARIAAQLDADPLLVTAWAGEVGVRTRPRPSMEPQGLEGRVRDAGPAVASGGAPDHQDTTAEALARAQAARHARERIAADPAFALTAGLLAGVAEIDAHAVTVTSDDLRVVQRVLDALLTARPQARTNARVVVRVGPESAGDLARHRIAAALALDVGQVTWTRWRTPPRPDAQRVLLRVADPELAEGFAGAVDAVLDPPCPDGDGF